MTVELQLNNPGPEATRSTLYVHGAQLPPGVRVAVEVRPESAKPRGFWQWLLALLRRLLHIGQAPKRKPLEPGKPLEVKGIKLGPHGSATVRIDVEGRGPARLTVRQVDDRGRVGGTTIDIRVPAQPKERLPNSRVLDDHEEYDGGGP